MHPRPLFFQTDQSLLLEPRVAHAHVRRERARQFPVAFAAADHHVDLPLIEAEFAQLLTTLFRTFPHLPVA